MTSDTSHTARRGSIDRLARVDNNRPSDQGLSHRVVGIMECPRCGAGLRVEAEGLLERSQSATLLCVGCGSSFPIVDSIPRFVGSDNYASNFGFQWNKFRSTQLDSHSGLPISRDRFLAQTGWTAADLRGKLVLDVGCGAGRFAEIALSLGAEVVAVDYSSAVDACWANLGTSGQLTVIQADLYQLPFKAEAFDYVYCFGVLQHTPNVESAVKALPRVLSPGGALAVDIYPKLFRTAFATYYWLRPITKRVPQDRLFTFLQRVVPMLLPVSRVLGRIPMAGCWLRHAIPVSNYEGTYPLTERQLNEWAVLDTYDMLAPAHDHPQTRTTMTRWLRESGLAQVEVFRLGQWVARGIKGAA